MFVIEGWKRDVDLVEWYMDVRSSKKSMDGDQAHQQYHFQA